MEGRATNFDLSLQTQCALKCSKAIWLVKTDNWPRVSHLHWTTILLCTKQASKLPVWLSSRPPRAHPTNYATWLTMPTMLPGRLTEVLTLHMNRMWDATRYKWCSFFGYRSKGGGGESMSKIANSFKAFWRIIDIKLALWWYGDWSLTICTGTLRKLSLISRHHILQILIFGNTIHYISLCLFLRM